MKTTFLNGKWRSILEFKNMSVENERNSEINYESNYNYFLGLGIPKN